MNLSLIETHGFHRSKKDTERPFGLEVGVYGTSCKLPTLVDKVGKKHISRYVNHTPSFLRACNAHHAIVPVMHTNYGGKAETE